MGEPLPYKRRVRVGTELPEPPPPRQRRLPILGLGLLAWVVAVMAGAALLDPQAASRWSDWAMEIPKRLASATGSVRSAASAPPIAPASSAPPQSARGGAGPGTDELVVREQSAGGAGGEPAAPLAITCEGAIRRYREAVIAGDAGPPRPVRENYHADQLRNGIYLRDCAIADELAVDVCAAIQHGRVLGVTVQTSPSRPEVERCVAEAVREIELDRALAELDVSHAHFEPRWR